MILFLAVVTITGLIFGRGVHADAPTTEPTTQPAAAAGQT